MIITAIATVKETFIKCQILCSIVVSCVIWWELQSHSLGPGEISVYQIALIFIHIWKGHKGSQNLNKRLDQNVRGLKVFLLLISSRSEQIWNAVVLIRIV